MSSMPLATACACKRVFTSPGCSKIGEISGQTVTREPLVFQWFLEWQKVVIVVVTVLLGVIL
jgi:hypothetical protein